MGICYIWWCGVLQYKRTKSLAGESLNTAANTERWMSRHRGFWTSLEARMCLCIENELCAMNLMPFSQHSRFHQNQCFQIHLRRTLLIRFFLFFYLGGDGEGVQLRAWECYPAYANPSSGLRWAFCQWLETSCCLTIHFLSHAILLLYHINKVNSCL